MKKLLLSLFVSFVGLISFCSAGIYIVSGTYSNSLNISYPVVPNSTTCNVDVTCTFNNFGGVAGYRFGYYYMNDTSSVNGSLTASQTLQANKTTTFSLSSFSNCTSLGYIYIRFTSYANSPYFDYECVFSGSDVISVPTCPTCDPQYTSSECQAEYDLVPSSNLSICESSLSDCQSSLSGWDNTLNNCSNNLLSCQSSLSSCIQSNCPFDTGDVQWSALYINNIQHLSSPVINIDIPENINWDYTYNTGSFDLYVGSGYDVEYIESIIDINSYRPTTEDFTGVFVGGLTLIMPYIIFVLFLVFMRKLIKRIFK